MKKIFTLCIFLMVANFTYADEECPPAVDAAEAQNHNAFKNCDYSNSGLNGVLHRAFSGKGESDEKTNEENKIQSEASTKPNKKVVDKPVTQKSSEFNAPEQLQNAKFFNLQKLALECPKGFVVEGERYLPVNGVMKLDLIYQCL